MRLRPNWTRKCICPKPESLSSNMAFIGVICYRHGPVSYDKRQIREIVQPVTGYLANQIEDIDQELSK